MCLSKRNPDTRENPRVHSGSIKAKFNYTHKTIIEKAGGEYVPGMMGELVMFNSPQTGSTLCLKEKNLTVAAVRQHIAESNKKFGVQ